MTTALAIMYHYVREGAGTNGSVRGLDPDRFAAQLDELMAWGEPITWPQFRAWQTGEALLPEHGFVCTFDDGLRDHVEVAAPMLEARGARGVFFVSGRTLDRREMLPAHAVHIMQAYLGDRRFDQAVHNWLAQHHDDDAFARVDDAVAESTYHYESPERARIKYLLSFALPRDVRDRMIDELFRAYVGDAAEWAGRWYLSPEQALDMHHAGHTIGGHGYNHIPLAMMSPVERDVDLRRCADVLGDLLPCRSMPFSYPFGSVNDAVSARCRAAGFVHAFTTKSGFIYLDNDPMQLQRVDTIHVQAHLEESLLCPAS